MRLLGLGSAVLLSALAGPLDARPFSATDILTICMTTPANPLGIIARFEDEGWRPLAKSELPAEADKWQLAMFLPITRPDGIVNAQTTRTLEYRVEFKDYINKALPDMLSEQFAVLKHDPTGALLIVDGRDLSEFTVGIACRLAVPREATQSQTFHPKLNPPRAGDALTAQSESFDFITSRASFLSQAVSVDTTEVEQLFGLRTEVAAIYYTSVGYPSWAVTP